MTATTVTTLDRLTIVKFLAAGRDLTFTAAASGHAEETVLNVAKHHGYPDVDKLSWAVDILEKNATSAARTALPTAEHNVQTAPVPSPHPSPVGPRPVTARTQAPASTPRPAPHMAVELDDGFPTEDTIEGLLNLGALSNRARTRHLTEKAEKVIALVRTEVVAERERDAAAAARTAAEAKVHAEVDALERKLAALKAQLPKSVAAKGSPALLAGVDPKAVRTWAAQAGVNVGPAGRLPRRVVEAYTAAHPTAA